MKKYPLKDMIIMAGLLLGTFPPSLGSSVDNGSPVISNVRPSFNNMRPIHEEYERRILEGALGSKQSKESLKKCVKEGHPIAQLEEVERGFSKHIKIKGVCEMITQSIGGCHSTKYQEAVVGIINREVNPQSPIEKQELEKAYELAQPALAFLMTSTNDESGDAEVAFYKSYFSYFPEFIGLAGLKPYNDFSAKEALIREEFWQLYSYWFKELKEAQKLSRVYYSSGREPEKATFDDRYPTAGFWLQTVAIAGEKMDYSYSLHVNRLLMDLDRMESTHENARIPWWKDENWNEA